MKTFRNPPLQLGAHTGTFYSDLGNLTVSRKYKEVTTSVVVKRN